ncbi:MAG TPA: hypothetical protein DEA73_03285 [Peptococcaceae bacterium]|nr:hypothetical protein [Peptococcaceae bacterium]
MNYGGPRRVALLILGLPYFLPFALIRLSGAVEIFFPLDLPPGTAGQYVFQNTFYVRKFHRI